MEHRLPVPSAGAHGKYTPGDQNLNEFREKPLTYYQPAVFSSCVSFKIKGFYDNSSLSQKFNGKNANSQ